MFSNLVVHYDAYEWTKYEKWNDKRAASILPTQLAYNAISFKSGLMFTLQKDFSFWHIPRPPYANVHAQVKRQSGQNWKAERCQLI